MQKDSSGDVAEVVRRARMVARLSQSQLGKVAGVPASTVARIEAGRVSPRIATLRQLLLACGKQLRLEGAPAYEPAAVAVARAAVDAAFHPQLADEERLFWENYWQASGLLSRDHPVPSPAQLLRAAARFAPVSAGAQVSLSVPADLPLLGLFSQIDASRKLWCATGAAAAQRLGAQVVGALTEVVVRCSDPQYVRTFIETSNSSSAELSLLLLPFDGNSEVGRISTAEGAWWADPLQVYVDCIGGNEQARAYADALDALWGLDEEQTNDG